MYQVLSSWHISPFFSGFSALLYFCLLHYYLFSVHHSSFKNKNQYNSYFHMPLLFNPFRVPKLETELTIPGLHPGLLMVESLQDSKSGPYLSIPPRNSFLNSAKPCLCRPGRSGSLCSLRTSLFLHRRYQNLIYPMNNPIACFHIWGEDGGGFVDGDIGTVGLEC